MLYLLPFSCHTKQEFVHLFNWKRGCTSPILNSLITIGPLFGKHYPEPLLIGRKVVWSSVADITVFHQEAMDPGQDLCRVNIPLAPAMSCFQILLSWGGGRLSARPDRALRAYILFFDILKLERAALLKTDTSS